MNPRAWRLPGYAELQELGAGTQGRVVLARHEASGLQAAIKYLAPDLLGDPHARETFRREAELLKRVTDPHVARLFGFLESAYGAAIVMEAVPGHSLRAVLDGHDAPLSAEGALAVLKGSLLGLGAAHSVGVVHRDYKPANVLVQHDGRSKLIDFGVAVLSGQGGVMGTPAYMAPEQWEGSPATPATDIYAATCVFYECVTGRRPFGASTHEGLKEHHIRTPVPLDVLPESLRPLVLQGMAKSPGHRQWNITAFVHDLEDVATTHYGPDWERRGLVTLGALTAAIAATLPVAMFGGLIAPGTVIGSSTQAVGEAGRALGTKGLLGKIGGAKGAAGAGAGAAVVVATAVLFWPNGPDVGGTSTGEYRAYFSRPRIILDNSSIPDGDSDASPLFSEKVQVTPARARAGTRVRVVNTWHGRTPWGLQYLGPGRFRCHSPDSERGSAYHSSYSMRLGMARNDAKDKNKPYLWLYATTEKSALDISTGSPTRVRGSLIKEHTQNKYYDRSHCAWTFNGTSTNDFTVPVLRSGMYKLALHHPIGIGEAAAEVNERRTEISPASAGARVEGSLPVLEVLPS